MHTLIQKITILIFVLYLFSFIYYNHFFIVFFSYFRRTEKIPKENRHDIQNMPIRMPQRVYKTMIKE